MEKELQDKLKVYRINSEEYSRICELLGREPEGLEWALFSALWSEHCSYKSSRVHLKKLYNQSDRVLEAFGENAGVVDLGEGERVAFKMESHNHPSFIEPYQGAATGVGGILRDIFTMGARPLALANYLCFGEADADRMSFLVDGVVRGIGGYGNCVGVPNVTGQTNFDSSYNGNILVNAFALGYFGKKDPIALSKAKGIGNFVVYVGAKTGKDGVHGASMASESFDDDSESKKPNVQIGDPFFEKCLIESCLEVIQANLVEAIQDMGAAGLTSSSFEMASKGQVGLKMNLDQVPIRDKSITPEEILLSESQERMLLVCKPEKFDELKKVFDRWNLDATVIGEVLKERKVEICWNGEVLSSIDPDLLVENAPAYERGFSKWASPKKTEKGSLKNSNLSAVEYAKKALSSLSGGSKEWIYKQYDQRVGAKTERDCSQTVGVIRLPETNRRLGMVLGCRPHVMQIDAFIGGVDSVAYPSLELASLGFEPLAMTDCLNFGNPEKEEIMSEFVAALDGMNQMARAVQTPIISGNVSFYNETHTENITSTPSTGIVGLRENMELLPQTFFAKPNEKIVRVQCSQIVIGEQLENQSRNFSGELDIEKVNQFITQVRSFALEALPSSARVVGRYGLEFTLAKMCLSGVGCVLNKTPGSNTRGQEELYSVVFTVSESDETKLESLLNKYFKDFDFEVLGQTQQEENFQLGDEVVSVAEIQKLYGQAWSQKFNEL